MFFFWIDGGRAPRIGELGDCMYTATETVHPRSAGMEDVAVQVKG